MIKPYVITNEQVKQYLNITVSTYDIQIDTWIPAVSDFLVNAKTGYLNNEYLEIGTASTTISSSNLSDVLSIDYDNLQYGNVVKIEGVSDNSTIVDYDESLSTIQLSKSATATATGKDLYIRVIPAGAKPWIAKMVWHMIKTNTTTFQDGIKSERIEDYSVTFDDSSSQLGAGGYPVNILRGLDAYKRPRFI